MLDLEIEKNFRRGYFSAFEMGKFSANLKRIQHEKGMKNKALAEAVRATPSMISKWRKNVTPEGHRIIEIANALGVAPEDLAGTSRLKHDADPVTFDITRGYEKDGVPVVGEAEASTNGLIIWGDDGIVKANIERWVSRSYADGDPKAYALTIRGDSMIPRYFPGEVIIAQPRDTARDGDFAVVQLKSGERLVKRVMRMQGGWVLKSLNPDYPDRPVIDDEVFAIDPIRHNISPRGKR